MKKRLIAIWIFVMLAFLLISCNAAGYSWAGTMMSHSEKADSWTISANTVNGNGKRTVQFTSDNLNALHIESNNSEGTVLLKLTQGDNNKTIDITGEFTENIDMSDFEPGNIDMHIEFEKAKDVNLKINW